MNVVKYLTDDLLRDLSHQARESSRLRQNYNFHELSEKVQRLLNVLQPGTYVRPHRHLRPAEANGFEFFLLLQGEVGLLLFDPQGQILQQERLRATGPIRGMELPQGLYHTLVCLQPDTVILELKEGPYNPMTDKEFLPMFPAENTPGAQSWVKTWQQGFENPMD